MTKAAATSAERRSSFLPLFMIGSVIAVASLSRFSILDSVQIAWVAVGLLSGGGAMVLLIERVRGDGRSFLSFVLRLAAVIISPLPLLIAIDPGNPTLEALGVPPYRWLAAVFYVPLLAAELIFAAALIKISMRAVKGSDPEADIAAATSLPPAVAKLAAMEAKFWTWLASPFLRKSSAVSAPSEKPALDRSGHVE